MPVIVVVGCRVRFVPASTRGGTSGQQQCRTALPNPPPAPLRRQCGYIQRGGAVREVHVIPAGAGAEYGVQIGLGVAGEHRPGLVASCACCSHSGAYQLERAGTMHPGLVASCACCSPMHPGYDDPGELLCYGGGTALREDGASKPSRPGLSAIGRGAGEIGRADRERTAECRTPESVVPHARHVFGNHEVR